MHERGDFSPVFAAHDSPRPSNGSVFYDRKAPIFQEDQPIVPSNVESFVHREGNIDVFITPANFQHISNFTEYYQSGINAAFKIARDYGERAKDVSNASSIHIPDDAINNPNQWLSTIPTEAQQKVLHLVATGMGNIEVASTLGISDQTVKNHMTDIMRRMKCKDRSEAVALAISQGLVEPQLITMHADFSRHLTLTSRERQLYGLLTTHGPHSNQAIADRMYITLQTVKNHMTKLLGKLGAQNRTEVMLYELKRREAIVSHPPEVFTKNRLHQTVLSILATEPSLKEARIPVVEMPSHIRTDKTDIYRKLFVANLTEATAVALLYGMGPVDSFARPDQRKNIHALSDDEKALIQAYTGYGDSTPVSQIAADIGMSPADLRTQLKKVVIDNNLPSIYQAAVILKLQEFQTLQENLSRRRAPLLQTSHDTAQTSKNEMRTITPNNEEIEEFADFSDPWEEI